MSERRDDSLTRLSDVLSADSSLDPPAVYWRTGFTLPAVDAGYAFTRDPVVADLLDRLDDGGCVALVDEEGAGKSTVCKALACEWHHSDRGPVFYGRPWTDTQTADSPDVASASGQALVVLEDATADEAFAVELVDAFEDRTDVSVLLEVPRSAVRDADVVQRPDDGETVAHALSAGRIGRYDLPPLSIDEFTDAVAFFQSLTDSTVADSPDTVFDDVRRTTVAGNELLHLAHRVSVTDTDEHSSLEQSVHTTYDTIAAADDLVGEVALVANVLNAAGIPLYSEFLFTVDAPNDATADAIATLVDDLLFVQPDRPLFRSHHRLWSSLYLQRFLDDAADPQDRFETVLAGILRAMDPTWREDTWAWIRDHSGLVSTDASDGEEPLAFDAVRSDLLQSSVRDRPTAVGTTADVVERVLAVGQHWPDLAPLFGTDTLPLDQCSTATTVKAHLARGEAYFDRGDYDTSLDDFERSRSILHDASDVSPRLADRLHVDCLVALGRVAVRRSDFSTAGDHYSHAHDIAVDLDDRANRARTHMHLGVVAVKTGDLTAATARLRAAHRLYRAIDDELGAANVAQRLGVVLTYRGAFDEAESRLRRALDTFQRTGDRVGVSKCRNNLGITAQRQGDLDSAESHFRQSLATNEEIGYRAGEAKNYLNLGSIASSRENYAAAEDAYQSCLEVTRELGDTADEAICLNNLGVAACDQNAFDRAADYYHESLELSRDIGDRRGEARALNNLGEVRREQGDIDRADTLHRESLDISRDTDDAQGQAAALEHLGYCATARGDRSAARDHLEEAADRYAVLEDDATRATVLLELAQVERDAGDAHAAVDYFAESATLADDSEMWSTAVAELDSLVQADAVEDWRAVVSAHDPELVDAIE